MRNNGASFVLTWIAFGVVAACATVAELEVKQGERDASDRDDPNAPPEDAAAGSDTSTPPPPSDGGAGLEGGDGSFLHCKGSDVPNGRVCCFASDLSRTFYAASCDDAGPQVCADVTECTRGTCEAMTCRGVALQTCGPMGEPRPPCP